MRGLMLFCCYTVLILGTVLLSILPDLHHLRIASPGSTYPLLHNYVHDYYGYLSEMKDGYDGKWLVSYRGTAEHNRPIFIYTFFIVLGKFARILNLSLPLTYFIARIVFGIGLLLSSLWLISKIFKSHLLRLTALFLVAESSGFWKLGSDNNLFNVRQYIEFWTHYDPINRTTFLPHHLISHMFGVFTIGLVAEAIVNRKVWYAVLAGILGVLAAISYHGTMTNILGTWGIFLPFWLIFTRNQTLKKRLTSVYIFTVFAVFTSLSLLYMLSLAYTVWPWTINSDLAGRLSFNISFREYVGVLGPTFILSLIGIPIILKSPMLLPKFLLCWSLFPFLGIFYLTRIFPQWSNQPYMEATSYIPFAILSVFGLQSVSEIIPRLKRLVYAVILLLLTIYFVPAHITSILRNIDARNPNMYTDYLPNNQMEGFVWLDKNTPEGSIVLAGGFTSAPLIAFTHNYVVYMDNVTTFRSGEKMSDLLLFFSQKNPIEGRAILQKYNIDYVFFSYDTDLPEDDFIKALPLTERFRKDRVVIYSVEKI